MTNLFERLVKWLGCVLGHDWLYCSEKPVNGSWHRECKKCSKRMTGTYDMSYGETSWENGWDI